VDIFLVVNAVARVITSTRKYVRQSFVSYKETRLALTRHDRPYSIQDSSNSVSLSSRYCCGILV